MNIFKPLYITVFIFCTNISIGMEVLIQNRKQEINNQNYTKEIFAQAQKAIRFDFALLNHQQAIVTFLKNDVKQVYEKQAEAERKRLEEIKRKQESERREREEINRKKRENNFYSSMGWPIPYPYISSDLCSQFLHIEPIDFINPLYHLRNTSTNRDNLERLKLLEVETQHSFNEGMVLLKRGSQGGRLMYYHATLKKLLECIINDKKLPELELEFFIQHAKEELKNSTNTLKNELKHRFTDDKICCAILRNEIDGNVYMNLMRKHYAESRFSEVFEHLRKKMKKINDQYNQRTASLQDQALTKSMRILERGTLEEKLKFAQGLRRHGLHYGIIPSKLQNNPLFKILTNKYKIDFALTYPTKTQQIKKVVMAALIPWNIAVASIKPITLMLTYQKN